MIIDDATLARLKASLTLHEDKRSFPYRDTKGKLTIGVGRNLDDVGVGDDEIDLMLENDIRAAIRDCVLNLPFFNALDPVRQTVLIELRFNMGLGNSKKGLLSFVNTLAAVAEGRWEDAASGLRKSKWYRDVKSIRGDRIIGMMRTGKWPELPT